MGVAVNKNKEAQQPKQDVKPSDKVLIELCGADRLSYEGVVYTKEQDGRAHAYEYDAATAQKLLDLDVEGKRMFRRHVPKPVAKTTSAGVRVSAPPKPEAKPAPAKATDPAAPAPTRVDLTTPEEEAELGLPPQEEEDGEKPTPV